VTISCLVIHYTDVTIVSDRWCKCWWAQITIIWWFCLYKFIVQLYSMFHFKNDNCITLS